MKKQSIVLLLLICSLATQAQYKKASFLNKSGRTYDIGITSHFVSSAHSTALGIVYSYGTDKGTKRAFHWIDLELTLPAKFSYNTTRYSDDATINVSGKTSIGLTYRYNFGWYLLDNSNEDNKVIPFLGAGFNFGIKNMVPKTFTYTPDNGDYTDAYKIATTDGIFSYGGNVTAGVIYKLSNKLALKGLFAYNAQRNINPNGDSLFDDRYFSYLTNHPYLSVGVRFRMDSDK